MKEFHTCQDCGCTFSLKQNLLHHKRSHTQAAKKEDTKINIKTEHNIIEANKPHTKPKYLSPGLFHSTLKKGRGLHKAKQKTKLIVVKNLERLQAGYMVLDQLPSGQNIVKIVRAQPSRVVATKQELIDDNEELVDVKEQPQDITDSLDKMLEEFEEEEKEEKKREAVVAADSCIEKVKHEDVKEEKDDETGKCEANYLNTSVKDEILDDGGELRYQIFIVKDSEVVGRVKGGGARGLEGLVREKARQSVTEKYHSFWSDIGLKPKVMQRTVDRNMTEQRKMKRLKTKQNKKVWSPSKNICLKKFASDPDSFIQSDDEPGEKSEDEAMTDINGITQHEKPSVNFKEETGCQMCGKTFLTSTALLAHLTLVRTFKCTNIIY